ncbi:hypothetical protein [Streptomyces sp. NPDC127038]|uniref:hypothetical protein n=1 Tax=Streptomyces sp. NPDC127038 TaxID=3347114 RepID=UPI00364877CF
MNGLLQPCADEDCRHTPATTTADGSGRPADGRTLTDRPYATTRCHQQASAGRADY